MIKDIQKKQETGTVKKRDTLENQAKTAYLAIGSNVGSRIINIEKSIFPLLYISNKIK